MTLYLDDGDLRLYHGDVLQVLANLPDESVDCVVTSPPYWGLRNYGVAGQLGLEPTPDLFVANMVAVLQQVRRVLAPHGTCWINLGDSYNSAASNQRNELIGGWNAGMGRSSTLAPDLKPKDLVGIPWRVAFALQQDGWWLRSDIIWAKPNPMPESVTDRPTKAHEYLFLLTKNPRYWFDAEAVREAYEGDPEHRYGRVGAYQNLAMNGEGDGTTPTSIRGPDGRLKTTVKGADGSIQHRDGERWPNSGRNVRTVWTIATQPYPEAHFATYPLALAARCIQAGCPLEVCRTCGKPRERIVERTQGDDQSWSQASRPTAKERHLVQTGQRGGHGNLNRGDKSDYYANAAQVQTLGWSDCGHNNHRPGLVLDPFIGSGTTALAARNHQRHAIGIELNADYCRIAAERLQQLSLLTQPQAGAA